MTMTPPPGIDASTKDAFALLQDELNQWGLGSLTNWAWQQLTTNNLTGPEVSLGIQQTPEFKARFPAIEARRIAGLAPISPAEYVSMERGYRQVMQSAGVPQGFYDSPDDFTRFIAMDKSPNEVGQILQQGFVAASQAPEEVRTELARRGVSIGNLAAYYLEPDKTLPLIQQQLASAQIGAASRQTGFGTLGLSEADQLAQLGVTQNQAAQGFNQLASEHELFAPLPGEATNQIDRTTQLAAEFEQNATAQNEIAQRQAQRKAQFAGGGGFNAAQGGAGSAQGA